MFFHQVQEGYQCAITYTFTKIWKDFIFIKVHFNVKTSIQPCISCPRKRNISLRSILKHDMAMQIWEYHYKEQSSILYLIFYIFYCLCIIQRMQINSGFWKYVNHILGSYATQFIFFRSPSIKNVIRFYVLYKAYNMPLLYMRLSPSRSCAFSLFKDRDELC